MENEKFFCVNIRDYFFDESLRENFEELKNDFVCSKNPDVEKFFKTNSVDFANKNQSVSYLVFSKEDLSFVGYFTITIKAVTINAENLSKTICKKLSRLNDLDEISNTFTVPAFLIAQLGKNFSNDNNQKIKGSELLQLAFNVIKELQYAEGGMVVFLEAEDNQNLMNFYIEQNGFKKFDTRKSKSNEKELVQLLRLL